MTDLHIGGFILALIVGAVTAHLWRLWRARDSGADGIAVGAKQAAATASEGSGRQQAPSATDLLLHATLHGMREGVLVVDQSMRVAASNPAAQSIFDRIGGALDGRRLSEITRNAAIYQAFRSAIDAGERLELKVEASDGRGPRIFELRVAPLRLKEPAGRENDDGSRAANAIGVFFDITQLERLEKVRQEFLSSVSHELRTPLTAILAFVETLEDGALEDPENNRRFLGIIRRNAERMQNLIDDILELSAIEAGRVQVELVRVPLRAMVTDVITALKSRADVREVRLLNQVDEDSYIFADARRLEQMLTNLVDNAVKFNRRNGSVTVTSERASQGPDSGETRQSLDRISVTDTGEGIAPEHQGRIFERFYRIDPARSREMGGTGLGLAIVKHLARAHGGEVSVRSTPGEGSTFSIDLPHGPPTGQDGAASAAERITSSNVEIVAPA